MIIISEAIADTYITTRKTSLNKTDNSNTGRAATLDLFKLCNESPVVSSEGLLKFTATPADEDTFALIDTSGNTVTFEFNRSSNIISGDVISGETNIEIGIAAVINNTSEIASRVADVINAVTGFDQDPTQTLNITAYSNADGDVVLRQDRAGITGDTAISETIANMTAVNFRRIERSALLIKFDLAALKAKYVSTFASSIFDTSSTTKFSAKVVLKDVSTGHTKPIDYSLVLTPLKKKFEEGLGKDTIHFSDVDVANFISLNNDTTNNLFEIPGYISKKDDLLPETTFGTANDEHVKTKIITSGDEDLEFDVTQYVSDYFGSTINNDYGFLIDFSSDNLEDLNSYFVKRLGSRHLLNKKKVPYLKLELKDDELTKVLKAETKRYLDNSETFYLFNNVNGVNEAFSGPAGYGLVADLEYNKNESVKSEGALKFTATPADNETFTLIDASGNTVIFKFNRGSATITGDVISGETNIEVGILGAINDKPEIASRVADAISAVTEFKQTDTTGSLKSDQVLNITSSIDASDDSNVILIQDKAGVSGDTNISGTVTGMTKVNFKRFGKISKVDIDSSSNAKVYSLDGNEILGIKKFILNSTEISAYNKHLNDEIVANGYATFDLTWKWYKLGELIDSFVVKKETVKLYKPSAENDAIRNDSSIRCRVSFKDEVIRANDTDYDVNVSFIDIKKQYDKVNVKYDIPCVNLGNLYYHIIDADDGQMLLEGSADYTKLFWNGIEYEFSLFVPKLFLNRRIYFEFVSENKLNSTTRVFSNKKSIVRLS